MAKRIAADETKKDRSVDGIAPRSLSKRLSLYLGGIALISLVSLGVFAQNGWIPKQDPISGERTGWFGVKFSEHATGSHWNPFADPDPPPPPPSLAKEYIYVGDQLLAIEDPDAPGPVPSDVAIWRPTTGQWWVMAGGAGPQVAQSWGGVSDKPLPGDYDGDGKTDFCVYRVVPGGTSEWWIMRSSDSSYFMVPFGADSDIPAPEDFDGDGKTDYAVWRPSDGFWYIFESLSQQVSYAQFGANGDTPYPKDYDGDGKADYAVWRPSDTNFYSLGSANSVLKVIPFGTSSSDPVSADYDGDGRADHAIRNGNDWIIYRSSDGQLETVTWQLGTDKAVHNDYDGDGVVDIAVWRDSTGTWYIRNSSDLTTRIELWGQSEDIPVPAFYRR